RRSPHNRLCSWDRALRGRPLRTVIASARTLGNRGGLYKSARPVARKRSTLPEEARRGARAPASGRPGAARRHGHGRDPRAPARGRVSLHVPWTPTCENPCLQANAPGDSRFDGWQNCLAAPPILLLRPPHGRLALPDVRALSPHASPVAARCPGARPVEPAHAL